MHLPDDRMLLPATTSATATATTPTGGTSTASGGSGNGSSRHHSGSKKGERHGKKARQQGVDNRGDSEGEEHGVVKAHKRPSKRKLKKLLQVVQPLGVEVRTRARRAVLGKKVLKAGAWVVVGLVVGWTSAHRRAKRQREEDAAAAARLAAVKGRAATSHGKDFGRRRR
jgi:hypothetical protein